MFESIKKWYDMGLWSAAQVRQAVLKGVISEAQYKEITGDWLYFLVGGMNLLLGLIHSLHYAAHIVVNGIDSRIHISQYVVKHLHSIAFRIFL